MTFFVKMNASLIFKNDGGLSTDFEYFFEVHKITKCAANFGLKICLIIYMNLKN